VDTGFNGTTDFTSTLGGNTANTSGFSGQIFAQKDLIVSQVAGGTLNITGGITTFSSSVNRAINFAGPGAINVSGSRIENGTGGGITAVNITNGTTTFSVDNTYTGATTISGGTLVAGAANAAGGTSNIVVNNGGSFLVTADDAIGTSTGIELNGGTLAFGAAGYDGYVGALTLSANSTIDLGTSSTGVLIRFSSINWSDPNALLSIYNWTGTTQWQGGTGNNLDQVYFTNTNLSSSELQRINFYSGIDSSSFVGDAFQIQGGFYDQQIIAVPEPETYLSAIALLAAFGIHILRRRATLREGHRPAWLKFLLGSGQTTPGHHPAPKPTELHLAQKV
jgi:autotransporter-associated beta strand protein